MTEKEKNPLNCIWLPQTLELQNQLFSIRVVCSNLIVAILHFSVNKHEHDFYEMHYITKGRVALELDDDVSILMSEGDFIILRPSVRHRIKCLEEQTEKFGFSFYLDSAEDEITFALERLTESHAVWRATEEMELLLRSMKNLSDNNSGEINRMMMNLLLEAYFLDVIGIVLTEDLERKSRGPILLGKDDVVETAKIYIALNANRPLSVDEVAAKMFFSTRQFSRIISKRCNCTPKELIVQARVDHIKKLLKDTAMSVTQIAESTGFKDASSIVKFFKSHTGRTPVEYRKDIASQRD